jgi:hypothetical protein
MKTILMTVCAAVFLMPIASAQHTHDHSDDNQMHPHHPSGEADGTPGVITGYVRDVACLVRNPKAGAATTPLTVDCMKKCVRGGSPVAILTEEGNLYTPISDMIPDLNARAKMLPYVGKYVKASGKMFARGGYHAISIKKIEVIERPANSSIPTL